MQPVRFRCSRTGEPRLGQVRGGNLMDWRARAQNTRTVRGDTCRAYACVVVCLTRSYLIIDQTDARLINKQRKRGGAVRQREDTRARPRRRRGFDSPCRGDSCRSPNFVGPFKTRALRVARPGPVDSNTTIHPTGIVSDSSHYATRKIGNQVLGLPLSSSSSPSGRNPFGIRRRGGGLKGAGRKEVGG